MLKTLAWKEGRELAPIVALGCLVQLYLACTATGMQMGFFDRESVGVIPFVGYDDAAERFFYVSGMLAFALGLWQTLFESSRGTFQFLLHRPVERNKLLATKLAVGGAATLLMAALPVVVYSVWAAAPGTHPSPFQWSMTAWCWQLVAQMLLVYLGAFLCGLRPGNWFGSRLLPIAACAAVIVALPAYNYLGWWTLPIGAATAAILVWVILGVGRTRDFS